MQNQPYGVVDEPSRRTSLPALLISCLLFGTACSSDDGGSSDYDVTGVARWATTRQLGVDIDPFSLLVTVNSERIEVYQLALCLERHPARGPQWCLDQLIDGAMVSAIATEADLESLEVEDARRASLASALLRDEVERNETVIPSDEDLASYLAEPSNRLLMGRPELRQFSHLLIQGPEGTREQVAALAERIQADSELADVQTIEDLERIQQRHIDAAVAENLNLRVEGHLLTQPHAEADAAYPAIMQVAPEFAEAIYAVSQPGFLPTPVETSFGTHFVLVERIYDPLSLPAEQVTAVARNELAQQRRIELFSELVTTLLTDAEVLIRYETLTLLRQDREARLRERSRALSEGLGQ